MTAESLALLFVFILGVGGSIGAILIVIGRGILPVIERKLVAYKFPSGSFVIAPSIDDGTPRVYEVISTSQRGNLKLTPAFNIKGSLLYFVESFCMPPEKCIKINKNLRQTCKEICVIDGEIL